MEESKCIILLHYALSGRSWTIIAAAILTLSTAVLNTYESQMDWSFPSWNHILATLLIARCTALFMNEHPLCLPCQRSGLYRQHNVYSIYLHVPYLKTFIAFKCPFKSLWIYIEKLWRQNAALSFTSSYYISSDLAFRHLTTAVWIQ